MADKLEITLDTSGISQAVQSLTQVGNAIGSLGMGGGGAVGGLLGGAVLAAAISGVDLALKQFTGSLKLATEAAQTLAEFGKMQFRLGSSTSQTTFLRALGSSLGVGDVAGSAARLHAASLSGLGAMEASRIGIQIRPNEIGTGTNRGEMLIQALEGLRTTFKAQGFGAAVAMARNLDVEEWLNVVFLMDRQFKQLKQDAASSSGIFGQKHVQAATQFQFEIDRLSRTMENAKLAVGGFLAGGINRAIPLLRGLFEATPLGGIFRSIRGLMGGGGAGGSASEQTQALRENTQELRQLNGAYGGGRRFRTAIPGAFGPGNGWALQNALRSHAIRLGAYSVSL